jgi:beta-glucosidase
MKILKSISSVILINLFIIISQSLLAQTPPYLDPNLPIDERVEDLLARMSLDEKVGQMTQVDRSALTNIDHIKDYYLGSILSGGGSVPESNTPAGWADMYDQYQQKALETELKIPLIYGVDAVHGHNNLLNAVIFPHNIGLGCTRSEELVEEAARITAIEVAATGIDWNFGPCVAVPRDERWGRTYEGFSESPELTAQLGEAAIRGYQGDTLSENISILACAKHFIGDGGTTGGDDQGNTEIDESTLREIHLPPYISAVENGVGSIMASFSSWNGDKVHGSKYLLTDLLKNELGFDGLLVSDWAAIDQLPGDYSSDVAAAINAGIDMVMVPYDYTTFISTLKFQVTLENISIDRIDDAVRRILKAKFELGLFEQPLTDRSLFNLVGSEEHREVARQAVRESLVLLKKKDSILPLPESGTKILVAGEHADNLGYQCGGWTIEWQGKSGDLTEGTTLLEGILQRVQLYWKPCLK